MVQNSSHPRVSLSTEFFQGIFLEAGDGIFLIDEQSLMVEMNPRGCEILGYSREELLGQPVLKFQPEDEIPHILLKLEQLSTEKLVTTESVFIHKNGTHIPVEITGKLLSNNQIIGLLRDISERKKAEQDLIDSERKFRSLVEQSPDGILMVNEEGLVVEWNQGLESISGIKRRDAIGKPIWIIQHMLTPEELRTEETLNDMKQKYGEILEAGRDNALNDRHESVFQLPDGIFHNVELMPYTYKTAIGYRIGAIIRDISEHKQTEKRLKYLALHDTLTDLPNRQLFQDRLTLAMERVQRTSSGIIAVMLLDLDNFKEVNDTYGHAYGDELLKIAARRLQTCLRNSDTAARMGGDEFTLIIEGLNELEGCHLVAQKVLESLSQPMEIEGQNIKVTASLGISLFTPSSNDADILLRQADIAMYQAKRQRNCYKFYTPPA